MNSSIFGDTSDVSSLIAAMNEEDKSGYQSMYWKPKQDGTTKIRFLPQLKSFGEKNFYKKFKVHYINKSPYFCLNQTLKDKDGNIHEATACPFCKKASAIYDVSTKGSPEWKLAGELRARDKYVSRIVVRGKTAADGKDTEAKPEFFEFGKKIHDMILAALESGEYGNPLDLKDGRDFSLAKHGSGLNTTYDGSMFSVQTSRIFADDDKVKTLLAELPKMDYSQLVSFETYEMLAKVLNNYLKDDVGEEEKERQEILAEKAIEDMADDIFAGGKPAPSAAAPHKDEENVVSEEDIDDILNNI